MSSTGIEHKGSSSGRFLYVPVWYNFTGRYSCVPEDESSRSIRAEDIVKIEILLYQNALPWSIF